MTKKGVVVGYPGPALVIDKGVPAKINWRNNIYGPHIFAVDQNHPFNSSSVFKNEIPLVPHVHGVATQTNSDGQPKAYWTALGNKGSKYSTFESC